MIHPAIETKPAAAGCPYVHFGKGKKIIAVFPPINDALFEVSRTGWYFRYLFGSLSNDYTFYIFGRKRHLPVGYTTQDMAGDYAEAFKELSINPEAILGISLGGLAAQYFAKDFPHYTKRLILISSAHHMGPEGLKIGRRWIPWARIGMWKEIYEDTVELSFRRHFHFIFKILQPILSRLVPKIFGASDFIISGQAGIIHDSSDILEKLSMPVLLIGGTQDLFFPEALFYEMSESIELCNLLIVKDARHGVLEEHRKKCLTTIRSFLNGELEIKIFNPPRVTADSESGE